jgi:hypothetical protein
MKISKLHPLGMDKTQIQASSRISKLTDAIKACKVLAGSLQQTGFKLL